MIHLALGLLLFSPVQAAFFAAAGKVDITPDLSRQRVYMAGYGAAGRKPLGVHDPLYARILLQSDGRKTVAIVGLDLLGFYRNDVEDLRRLTGFSVPERSLFVAATHNHSGPDTLGLWGPYVGISGVNHAYHKEIKEKVSAKIVELMGQLKEVKLESFSGSLDPRGLCRDSRNPTVINPDLAAFRYADKAGKTVAAVVNWSCHPEVLGPANRLITADYPGPLCGRIEEKLGGTCVFLSGTLGGLMTPDTAGGDSEFKESSRVGKTVADFALNGLLKRGVVSKNPALGFKSETLLIPIENSRYLALLPALTFGHLLFDRHGKKLPAWKSYWLALKHLAVRLDDSDRPWVQSEVSRIDIGPVGILGIPGEIFPELVIGGYDGKFRAGHPLIDSENPNPPDLSAAPQGPYLKDYLRAPVKMVVGLANDELGYIMPAYDFKIQRGLLMLPRLPGHHYEETNSIGVSAAGIVEEGIKKISR